MADQRKQAVQAEPLPTEAGEILREGGALVRLENETQMQIAIMRPRDESKILKASLAELDIYPENAEKVIYNKPVGKMDKCPACGAETHYKDNCPRCGAEVPQKYATGLSVRAAENLGNRWDNSAFGAQVLADDGNVVDGAAVFCDYERNTRALIPFRVSRTFRRRDGSIGRHQEDRFNDLVVKAALAKALREVILRKMPAGLRTAYERRAREILAEKVIKDPKIGERMLLKFSMLGVTKEMIEKLVGKPIDKFVKEDFINLKGVANAIEDGELTIDAAFHGEEEAPPAGEGSKARADELKARLVAAKVEAAEKPKPPHQEPEPAGVREILDPPEEEKVERARTLFPLGGEKQTEPELEPEKAKRGRPPKPLSAEELSAAIQQALDKIGFDQDEAERKAFVALAGGLAEASRIVQKMESAKQLGAWMKFKQERQE